MLKQPTGNTVGSEYITTSVHSGARQEKGHQLCTNGSNSKLIRIVHSFGIGLLPMNILVEKTLEDWLLIIICTTNHLDRVGG